MVRRWAQHRRRSIQCESVTQHGQLVSVLERSRELGLLGPGDIDTHIRHADGFVSLVADRQRLPVLDLGSGGGVPGLVIACEVPDAELVLVDAQARRCAFLREAVRRLDLADRVSVVNGRAEDLARAESYRERFGTVVARSFGRPALTAECAVGFLLPGGSLFVSEPPDEEDRWPAEALRGMGFDVGPRTSSPNGDIRELRRSGSLPDLPRPVGVPARRPLF